MPKTCCVYAKNTWCVCKTEIPKVCKKPKENNTFSLKNCVWTPNCKKIILFSLFPILCQKTFKTSWLIKIQNWLRFRVCGLNLKVPADTQLGPKLPAAAASSSCQQQLPAAAASKASKWSKNGEISHHAAASMLLPAAAASSSCQQQFSCQQSLQASI